MQIQKQAFNLDQKQVENVEYFNYSGSITTNDARHPREIKSKIYMAKGPFDNHQKIWT